MSYVKMQMDSLERQAGTLMQQVLAELDSVKGDIEYTNKRIREGAPVVGNPFRTSALWTVGEKLEHAAALFEAVRSIRGAMTTDEEE